MNASEVTMSGKKSLPYWMQDTDEDIQELQKTSKENEVADRELEKRVAKLEFKMIVIMVIGSGAWSVVMALFVWLLGKV